MKFVTLVLICLIAISCSPLGYPVNEGREYGNPTMPWMVSHLPNRNQVILQKHSTPRHHIFTRILCFKQYCRMRIGRQKSLKPITYDKFKKKIAKNAKKDMYKYKRDSTAVPMKKPIKEDTSQIIMEEKPPVIDQPVLKADSLITLSDVLFETNSATLKSEHFSDLASVIDFMIAHPLRQIKVSGHTDNTGTETRNMSLSFKRAEVVAEYLIDNGVAADRVTFEGLGSSKPLQNNTTTDGRSKNRRVELLIHDQR